jgi:arabinose-5-phosphate isomerase
MRSGDAIPSVREDATLADAIIEISRKGLGMTAIVDRDKRLVGLFTDGDLRRTMERNADPRGTRIDSLMTRSPCAIPPEALAVEAVELMDRRRITQLPVVDAAGRLVGALNIHDLFRAKIL